MKTSFSLLSLPALLLLGVAPLLTLQAPAQEPVDPSGAIVADVKLSREQVKELVGPVALYPDPLLSMILPASTYPSDVVLAARFVESGDDPTLADEKPWDESIRGLTRYPDLLAWMDENLEWTTQLGYAYLAQPEDVMDVVQELRAQAQSVGNLVDTPQQRIVREEQYIRIIPAEPEYIYVPYYDPEIVYYERPYAEPYITYSLPWLVGAWLTFDFDWRHRRLYCGDWHGHWDYHHHDRRDDTVFINNSFTTYELWRGDSRRRLASTRDFAVMRDRLRERTLASPTYFTERFDLAERDRFAVPVRQEIRERDRRDAIVASTATQVQRDRTKVFDSNGRIRTRDGQQATLTSIADREQQRVAAETKRREEFRERLAKEGKLSQRKVELGRERDRETAARVGVGTGTDTGAGKMRKGERTPTTTPTTPGVAERDRERIGAEDSKKGKGKGKESPDSRMTERALPGETVRPAGEAPKIGERTRPDQPAKKMGEATKEGERGKGETTAERGKSGVPIPRGTPPAVTGEARPDKRGTDETGKGKGKSPGKDAPDRGPTSRTDIPKAELPTERPGAKDMPKAEPPKGRPEMKDIPKAELPKRRPAAKEMPKGPTPAPVIPDDTGKRGSSGKGGERSRVDDEPKGKGKSVSPPTAGPRSDAPRVERPAQPKSEPTPRIAPQPKQEGPKARPAPPVNVEPPKPKVQTPQQPPSVRPAPPQPQQENRKKKADEPSSARRSAPSAPNVARQAPAPQPKPQKPVAAAPRPQPQMQKPQVQKPVASAPRPQPQEPKPQTLAVPKPQSSAGGKKASQDEDEKKKEKK